MHILVTDAQGRQSGIVPIPDTDMSFVKEEIPESHVETLDDEKYVYLPSGNYTVTLQGYADGISTVEVGKVESDGTITATQSFDVPTTASTSGSFLLAGTSVGKVTIDTDGGASSTPIVAPTLASAPQDQSMKHGSTAPRANAANKGAGNVSPLEILYLQLKLKLLELQLALFKLLHAQKARETTVRFESKPRNMRSA